MHHIISDGWSLGVLVRELGALYDAYRQGREDELPELPIQYGDYAEWQRGYLSGAVLDEQLDHWRERLGGNLPVLELPAKRPRSAVRSFRGSQYSFCVSRELTESLRELSRESGTTLFMTLAAAYAALLVRYTNQEELLVGTPFANRTLVETEDLIGCFVNTLVLRIDAAGNPRFTALLERVRQVALEAYAHHDVPFEKLVEELRINRDTSHTPLFQTMLALQNYPAPELHLPGLRIAPVKLDREIAKYDLTLSLGETAEGLAGIAQFNRDLFDGDMIEGLIGHWQQLLRSIVKNPSLPIWEYQILTPFDEKRFEEWNRTEAVYERDKTIIQLFTDQVK